LGAFFNIGIISLALVGYEMIIVISYPTHAGGIIVLKLLAVNLSGPTTSF